MNESLEALEVSRQRAPELSAWPTAEEKSQWAKQFLASGLSIRAFCAQHNLGRMSLWRWVHGRCASPGAQPKATPVAFAELKPPASLARCDWAVEITLPSGTIVRMSQAVPEALVSQLLRLC